MTLPAMVEAKCPECGTGGPKIVMAPGHLGCPECKTGFVWEGPKTDPQPSIEAFDQWALVELFGHQQIVGRVTQSTQLGGAFLRVDVPEVKGVGKGYTRFFHPNAVYSINPLEEAVARSLLTQSRFRNEPVSTFNMPLLTDGDRE